ncbi:hypothetical protein V7S43_011056 [Phytophthora oleae]|uniref:Transposase n=1 Tax=Phytophthora oleae TaxID=2107226 RepID=A0ABD3FE26_9STRA
MPEKQRLSPVQQPLHPRTPQREPHRANRKHWQKGGPGKHWRRPARGGQPTDRPRYVRNRVPEGQRVMEPLLTSWFKVDNFIDEDRPNPWRTSSMPPAPIARHIVDELTDLGVFGDDATKVNSISKLRLYPTKEQKQKLDQMFAANRAVYNKLVGTSKEDRATRLATVIDCKEEYTSKTCSTCGEIKDNLGGNHVFRCTACGAVLDRDVNAARNIFHKNMSLLG